MEEIKPKGKVLSRRVRVEDDIKLMEDSCKGAVPEIHTFVSGGSVTGGIVSGTTASGYTGFPGEKKKHKLLTTISVYVDNGNVYQYEVHGEAKAREHASAIIETGYRSVNADTPELLTWFPPSRILKVVLKLPEKSSTKYFDRIVST